MFSAEIIEKLKEIGFNADITKNYDDRTDVLVITTDSPYFIFEVFYEEVANKLEKESACLGRVTANDKTYIMVKIPSKKKAEEFKQYKNEVYKDLFIVRNTIGLYFNEHNTNSITLKDFTPTNAPMPTADKSATNGSNANDNTNTNTGTFFIDYATKHNYFYLYKSANPKFFKDFKTFRLYSILQYIFQKSHTNGNTCLISPSDLRIVTPLILRRKQQYKDIHLRESQYTKGYVYFTELAIAAGMLKSATPTDDEYIELTFSNEFLNNLKEPPYITIPFELIKQLKKSNYNFLIYFFNRLFKVSPTRPYTVNIKTRELLKIIGITKTIRQKTEYNVERLNNCFSILHTFGCTKEPIIIEPNDIKKNTLLSFRLLQLNVKEEPEEPEEPTTEDEPQGFQVTKAFQRANARLETHTPQEAQ